MSPQRGAPRHLTCIMRRDHGSVDSSMHAGPVAAGLPPAARSPCQGAGLTWPGLRPIGSPKLAPGDVPANGRYR